MTLKTSATICQLAEAYGILSHSTNEHDPKEKFARMTELLKTIQKLLTGELVLDD